MNNVIAYIATLMGLALIIAGWFIWGDQSQMDIFILNICVSVVAYCVMFVDILLPWGDLRDKTQRRIGNTGVRWFVQYGYSITAILLLILCNLLDLSFVLSLFLQSTLLVLMLFGIATSMTTSQKIAEVSNEHNKNIDCVQLMRDGADDLSEAARDAQAPQLVVARITRLKENLRFISPSNSATSRKVENEIVELMATTKALFRDYEINSERIDTNIAKAERLIEKRKSTYSN